MIPKEEWEERVCLFFSMRVVETERPLVIECPTYNDIRSSYGDILETGNLATLFEENQLVDDKLSGQHSLSKNKSKETISKELRFWTLIVSK